MTLSVKKFFLISDLNPPMQLEAIRSMGEAGPGDAVETDEVQQATRGRECLAQ